MTSALEVTSSQLADLVAATGQSEQDIRGVFDELKGKFPSDGITEEKFLELFKQVPAEASEASIMSPRDLFAITDRDHSGKISLYELILATALFGKKDRETVMNALFKLCDTNHDGFVTPTELVDILAALVNAMDKDAKESNPKEFNDGLEKTKIDVGKVFGDKTKVSQPEFRQFSMENETISCILESLQLFAVISLVSLMASFQ